MSKSQANKKDRSRSNKSNAPTNRSQMSPSFEFSIGDDCDVHKFLDQFWSIQMNKIQNLMPADLRDNKLSQELPLARIKKIMKLDDDVKMQMISAEAPAMFAKACEIFIQELTVRAWVHTEDNKRKTLQKNDIAMAISKHDQFDFLIDIVPREEIVKTSATSPLPTGKRTADNSGSPTTAAMATIESHLPMLLQLSGAGHTSAAQPMVQHVQLQNGQIVQTQSLGQSLQLVQGPNGELQLVNTASVQPATSHQQQEPVVTQASAAPMTQAYQQVIGPDGSVHHLPIQLSPAQLNFLKQHIGGNGQQIQIMQNSTGRSSQQSQQTQQQTQQPAAFFIQTPGPVAGGQAQQQIQLQMVSADQHQVSDIVSTSAT